MTLLYELARARIEDRRRAASRASLAGAHVTPPGSGITIRLARGGDGAALARLAALEERSVPPGRVLVGVVDGALVAALPLDGGESLADPFQPTFDLLSLLRLRARQLAPARPRARRLRHAF
jgi:hypothetical protein